MGNSNNRRIRQIIGITLFAVLVILEIIMAVSTTKDESSYENAGSDSPNHKAANPYLVISQETGLTAVTNKKDGYSFVIPDELTGSIIEEPMNEELSGSIIEHPMNIEIDSGKTVYEIYFEAFSTIEDKDSYLSYSNLFMQNKRDHFDTVSREATVNDRTVLLSKWKRSRLSRIENDKNYYLCADVIIDDLTVCTFFMKSEEEIDFDKQCLPMIESLNVFPGEPEKYPIENYTVPKQNPSWNKETAKLYDSIFGKYENGIYKKDETGDSEINAMGPVWGVYKWGIEEDWSYLTDLENTMNKEFDVLLYYSHFNLDSNTIEDVRNVLSGAEERGRTVELTLQTEKSDSGNMVYDILNGYYDDFIREYANVIKEVGAPVLFRLCNEMNGDWCEYSAFHTARDAVIFTELYKYIYSIFQEEGANEFAIWVWNPNEKSFPDFKWNNELKYYPGDEYVDVVGITGYNTGSYYSGEYWRSFDEIYQPLYDKAVKYYNKPLMITEFSCSSIGGDKAAWVEDMFQSIGKYPEIKLAVWWDGCDYDETGRVARSYLMEDSPEVVQIFKNEFNKNSK